MFVGNFHSKIDDKGRVPFPSIFRKLLGDDTTLIASRDLYENCIRIQPLEAWKEEEARLTARLDEFDREHRQLRRQFALNAHPLTLDSSGRILLPKSLLTFCNINKDVSFVGIVDSIELWSKECCEGITLTAEDYANRVNTTLIKPLG